MPQSQLTSTDVINKEWIHDDNWKKYYSTLQNGKLENIMYRYKYKLHNRSSKLHSVIFYSAMKMKVPLIENYTF